MTLKKNLQHWRLLIYRQTPSEFCITLNKLLKAPFSSTTFEKLRTNTGIVEDVIFICL